MRWWQRDLCPLLSFPGENINIASSSSFQLVDGPEYIFLTETMCRTTLLPRQACAAESFARHNPDKTVVFLMTSQRLRASDPYIKLLIQIENVKFSFLELDHIFANTPLRKWFLEGVWNENTKWPYMNLSDALRFLIVYRYGGIYLDSDFVSMRKLPSLRNWVGRQDHATLAAGAYHFDKNHTFMERAIHNFLENFNPTLWANNGPGVVTRVMKQLCKESNRVNFPSSKALTNWKQRILCGGVKVLPPEMIYPIHFNEWQILFEPGVGHRFLQKCSAYGVHMWNKLSVDVQTRLGDGSIYDVTAKEFCPGVYNIVMATNSTL